MCSIQVQMVVKLWCRFLGDNLKTAGLFMASQKQLIKSSELSKNRRWAFTTLLFWSNVLCKVIIFPDFSRLCAAHRTTRDLVFRELKLWVVFFCFL